jgi:hypothetical protein
VELFHPVDDGERWASEIDASRGGRVDLEDDPQGGAYTRRGS